MRIRGALLHRAEMIYRLQNPPNPHPDPTDLFVFRSKKSSLPSWLGASKTSGVGVLLVFGLVTVEPFSAIYRIR